MTKIDFTLHSYLTLKTYRALERFAKKVVIFDNGREHEVYDIERESLWATTNEKQFYASYDQKMSMYL